MKEILITQNKFALVDDEDFKYLNQFKWFYSKGYAVRSIPKVGGGQTTLQMHRLVINATKGLEVDHINRDGLDNRKENLRLCTRSQNEANIGLSSKSTTGYKGVDNYSGKSYRSRIRLNGERIVLGYFDDVLEAAKAYDVAAKKHFGEFAVLNFPEM